MAIALINENVLSDPGVRSYIFNKLKNIECLSKDPTLAVKEYKFTDDKYGEYEKVDVKIFITTLGSISHTITPLIDPTNNFPKVSILDIYSKYINPGTTFNPTLYTTLVEFCKSKFGIDMIIDKLSVPSNEVSKFVEQFNIFSNPLHHDAPWVHLNPKYKNQLMRSKITGQEITMNLEGRYRSDYFELLNEFN